MPIPPYNRVAIEASLIGAAPAAITAVCDLLDSIRDALLLAPSTPPDEPITVVTDIGMEILGMGIIYQIDSYSVGTGGLDNLDPRKITRPDPTLQTLESEVYLEAIAPDVITKPSTTSIAIPCRIPHQALRYGLGELGTWAVVTANGTPTYPVGFRFLFTTTHFPILCAVDASVHLHRVVVNL